MQSFAYIKKDPHSIDQRIRYLFIWLCIFTDIQSTQLINYNVL